MPEGKGPVVQTPALLRSVNGAAAECVLETWKERSLAGRKYTQCRIVNDPPDLPDGEYTVEFGVYRIRTRKLWGMWTLTFLAPGIEITDAA